MRPTTTHAAGCAALTALLACSTPATPLPDAAPDAPSAADAANDAPSPRDDAAGDDASDGAPATTAAERAAFDLLLADARRELTAGHTPGASIAVVLHGRLAFAAGVGVRDTASGEPVTTATRFRAASMSKMVLAAAAMSLARDGMLDVRAPITRYLPWFHLAPPFDAATVTLHHLLSHSSGFPSDTISQCATGTSGPRQDFFANHPQPLWAPPGAVYDYSNTGYSLAAVVLTAAAGMHDADFEQLARDRVFVPAGMTTATYDTAAALAGEYATGYVLDASGAVAATVTPDQLACPLLDPPGGVLATATDYAHLAEALLADGGAVLDAAGVRAMESTQVDTRSLPTRGYGYGLVRQFSPYPDHTSVWHDGSLPGYLSLLWMVPDAQLAVVAMVNARGTRAVPEAIVGDALARFLPEARRVPDSTTPPSAWAAYAGTYDDAFGTLGAGVTVSLVGGDGGAPTLTIDAPNATSFAGRAAPVHGAMTQQAVDTWVLPDGTVATFFPGAAPGSFAYLATRRGVAVR